ncbi:MAG: DUF4412 domain-containing protein [candidate division Zixibacteria bacterium]|nr:DUF4412 domain-containing protein [candidate division Zixibacteria bacterium]
MRRKNLVVMGCFVGVLLLVLPALLQADVFYKMQIKTDAYEIMGQKHPAEEHVVSVWLAKGKAYMDMDTAAVLVDGEKEIMYMINHSNKSYLEMPMGGPAEMAEAMGAEGDEDQTAAMKEMMKNMAGTMKFTVTPTDESKKIGEYKCKKYLGDLNAMMAVVKMEIWATEDIDIDMSLYYQMSSAAMDSFPGYEKLLKEWEKIKRFPVLTTNTTEVVGTTQKTTSELIELTEKDAPKGTYDLPKGYKKTEMPGGKM